MSGFILLRWPRFLPGGKHALSYCSFWSYCTTWMWLCMCMRGSHMHDRARVFGFYICARHISEVMTRAEKWVSFKKRRPFIVWSIYWSRRDLKIQMIVFLWWSRSTPVPFCVLQKWFPRRPQSHSSSFGWKADGLTKFAVALRNRLLLRSWFFMRHTWPDTVSLTSFPLH